MIEFFFLLVFNMLFRRESQIQKLNQGRDDSNIAAAFWFGTSFEAEHQEREYNQGMSDSEYDKIDW